MKTIETKKLHNFKNDSNNNKTPKNDNKSIKYKSRNYQRYCSSSTETSSHFQIHKNQKLLLLKKTNETSEASVMQFGKSVCHGI